MLDAAALQRRLADVHEQIHRAAGRAGRDPSTIRLVAVSKTFPVEHVRVAAEAGQVDFGENKVQEGLQKIAQTADLHIKWHLVGHLQSNKARKAGAGGPVRHENRRGRPAGSLCGPAGSRSPNCNGISDDDGRGGCTCDRGSADWCASGVVWRGGTRHGNAWHGAEPDCPSTWSARWLLMPIKARSSPDKMLHGRPDETL